MPLELLLIPQWVGDRRTDTEIQSPSWEQIEDAIRSLDNDQRNDLYLIPSESNKDVWLCIGGGNGRYVVTGATSDGKFPTVVDPSRPDDQREYLVVGGQGGDYPARMVVSLDLALRAVRGFYQSAQFTADDVFWVVG